MTNTKKIGDGEMNNIITINEVKTEQDRFINAIIESGGANLPATIEEIIPVVEFSKARMTAYKALSDAAGKVEQQEALNKAALESGQRWGIVHLYGQKKLGELTREVEPMPKTESGGRRGAKLPPAGKAAELRKVGISKPIYSDAERIARNPEILDRVIETAKEQGDIPTKTRVLNEIKKQDAQARVEKKKEKATEKKVRETPKAVKEYFDAVKAYSQALGFAIEVAKRRLFSEESISIIKTKHNNLKEQMSILEDSIEVKQENPSANKAYKEIKKGVNPDWLNAVGKELKDEKENLIIITADIKCYLNNKLNTIKYQDKLFVIDQLKDFLNSMEDMKSV